ncbi:MAG: hypothetical protein HKP58_00620, partial [Desulfatitalea sp.]|nr:hypothetical protein [Desulfatitalea sp.]NNJ98893.1 hypothetical protein [Desulfatitalea sp.]
MLPQSVLVEGQIIGSEAATGLADLRIETWCLGEDELKPLAESQSDAQGRFVSALPLIPECDVQEGIVRFEFRIYDRGDLILTEVRELSVDHGPVPIQFFVPIAMSHQYPSDAAADASHEPHEVHGRIWGPIIEGANIRGVAYSLGSDGAEHALAQAFVGETPVDRGGVFKLQYDPFHHGSPASETRLVLQLVGPDDTLLIESSPVDMTRRRARVDLHMPGGKENPCEYELLEDRMFGEIEEGPAILDDLSADDLFELADEIDVEPERLALLQRVRALAVETGLPAPMFYALGGNGMSVELADLIDVPLAELHATITAAIDDGIVNETQVQGVASLLAQLSERVLDRVLETGPSSMGAGLGELIASADLPREVTRTILGRYQARSAGATEFWESLVAGDGGQEAVDEQVRSALEMAIDIGGLLGAESALVRKVLSLRKQGRWQMLEDLAEFDLDDWCQILESVYVSDGAVPDVSQMASVAAPMGQGAYEGSGQAFDIDTDSHILEAEFEEEFEEEYEAFDDDEDVPDDDDAFDEATDADDDADDDEQAEHDWVAVRAEAIRDTLEEAFPSRFIRKALHQSEVLSEGAHRLLERVPRHDLLSASIRERALQDPDLLEGYETIEAEFVIEEVEAVERVSRVTHHAEEVAVLVGTGMRSAQEIAAQPRRHFIDAYGEALGGRAQASRVHAQAQQAAGAS